MLENKLLNKLYQKKCLFVCIYVNRVVFCVHFLLGLLTLSIRKPLTLI